MSSEPSNDSNQPPLGSVTTYTYDGRSGMISGGRETTTFYYDDGPAPVEGARPVRERPPAASAPAQPVLTHTFGFRLTGAETQEQCVPLAAALGPAACCLATTAVRAYLTRTADPAAASSAIGGVEVAAELHAGSIVCRASLSDFGPGDLVVVQVDVALFDRGQSRWGRQKIAQDVSPGFSQGDQWLSPGRDGRASAMACVSAVPTGT